LAQAFLPPISLSGGSLNSMLAEILGTSDEGILFGALIAVVFVFIYVVEYVRAKRAQASNKKSLRREQYANAAVWGVMLTMAAAGSVIAPNDAKRRDISILLTCGAAMQLLAFGLLFVAPRRSCPDQTLPRAPADFMILMAVCLSIRVIIEMKWNGYLPIDRTGDGCIQIIEGLSLLICVYNIGQVDISKPEAMRALKMLAGSFAFGQLCYGELDGTPMPDKAFAASVYMELCGWVCMYRFVSGRGRDAVNSMFLPPTFVQGMCRAYFWYMAAPETTIRQPVHIIQVQFPWVLITVHVLFSLLALVMSVLCVREFNPALPHNLLNPNTFSV